MICGLERHQGLFHDRPRQRQDPRQSRRRGTQGRPRADRHHRNSLQRQPRRAGRAHRRAGQRKSHHRHHRRARRIGREHAASSSKSSATPSPRSSSTISTSTPRWRPASPSTPWPSITAAPRRSASRRSSIATSSIAAKSSSAAPASSCARPRSAPKRWRAISSRWPTWTNSSASSANPATARRRKIKLLAFDFTRQQVEQIGIIIRSEARLTSGRYSFSEAQANAILELRLYQLTGLEVDKVRAEYTRIARAHQGFAGHSGQGSARLRHHQSGTAGDQGKIRHAAPDRTGARRRRDRHRRPDRQRRRHHHHHPRRLDQAHQRQFLSRPAPRRQGRHRHDHPRRLRRAGRGRGFHRASFHRQHARLPDVLHQHRPRLRRARP